MLAVRGRVSLSSFDSRQFDYRSTFLRATVNADVLLPILRFDRFSLQLGPSVGLPMVRQRDDQGGELSSSYGFSYAGVATLNALVFGRTALSLTVEGGGEIFRLNGARVHRAAGSALLGAVVGF
jgi:hypothetical protein